MDQWVEPRSPPLAGGLLKATALPRLRRRRVRCPFAAWLLPSMLMSRVLLLLSVLLWLPGAGAALLDSWWVRVSEFTGAASYRFRPPMMN